MSTKIGSKPVKSSQRKGKSRGKGKPFQKNDPANNFFDPRINRTGQNKGFGQIRDEVRQMAQDLLAEQIDVKSPETKQKKRMSNLQFIFRDWIVSRDVVKQEKVVAWAAGKVADELIVNNEIEQFLKDNIGILTDGEIDRLNKGEDAKKILAGLLEDVSKLRLEAMNKE